jgi:TPR repeat protein
MKPAFRLGLIVALLHAAGVSPVPALAETAASTITAPEQLQISAGAEQPLPVSVVASDEVPKNSMLLISGLPSTTVLSAGRLFASGTWALRLSDLNGLKIETTAGASGQTRLSLSIVTLDGRALAERSVSLSILPQSTGAIPSAAAPSPGPTAPEQRSVTPTATAPAATPGSDQNPQVLMARGDANLAAGKIPVARLFYRRATEAGWAPGAMAMAQTYDPHELAKLGIVGGVQPDPDQAREWYERARTLGASDADGKLRRLSQR